jgi:hypothetical protein
MDEDIRSARKFQNKTAAQARHTGEEFTRRIENTYSNATQGAIEYHRKALEMAQANINSAFECAQELLGVTSPSEFIEVTTKHARQQVQAMTEQTRELSALAQKAATNGIGPLTIGLAGAFRETT